MVAEPGYAWAAEPMRLFGQDRRNQRYRITSQSVFVSTSNDPPPKPDVDLGQETREKYMHILQAQNTMHKMTHNAQVRYDTTPYRS